MKKILTVCSMLFLVAGSIGQAHASSLQDHGIYFTDKNTQLDWLDLVVTVNRSPEEVMSQLKDKGSDIFGYRYATGVEVTALIQGYTGTTATSYQQGVLAELVNLIGATYIDSQYEFAHGVVGESTLDSMSQDTYAFFTGLSVPYDYYAGLTSAKILSERDKGLGHFLVRASVSEVPLPQSYMMFLTGLFLMAGLLNLKRN